MLWYYRIIYTIFLKYNDIIYIMTKKIYIEYWWAWGWVDAATNLKAALEKAFPEVEIEVKKSTI
jgi:hypothetical protein